MSAREEYQERLKRKGESEQVLARQFIRIGNFRLLTGIATAALAWLVFAKSSVSPWWLLVPIAGFLGLVAWHSGVIREREKFQQAAAYYERGLARLSGRWAGTGISGERFRDGSHVYADDLDVFGTASLFELICTARTTGGQERLAAWLKAPARYGEARARQQAAQELRMKLNLREALALAAGDVRADIDVGRMGTWGSEPAVPFPFFLAFVASVTAVCGVLALIGFFAQAVPLTVLLVILLLNSAIIYVLRERVNRVLGGVETTGRELKVFSAIVRVLEEQTFASPRLAELQANLKTEGEKASERIRKLSRLVDWHDSSDHVLIRILRPLTLWQEQLAMAFERWRRKSGSGVAKWIDAVADFEALSSLAATAYEQSSWTFPELLKEADPRFEAVELKHPLLPGDTCVPNDLSLRAKQPLLIVSGSNMSGKSTLLRSAGLNTVLAWAGAPVAARQLRVSRLQTGASMRANDSLQDHRSRFLAEIQRLKQILDLTRGQAGVLFLLDELLSGTNSHDRRIGADGIVSGLLRRNAIGFITTHDLALAHVGADLPVLNVHFEDQMYGAEMTFDYKLKPGVVTRSNALELMRAVGLDV